VTKNTLLLSAITIIALTLGWATATAVGQSHPLRSRHGEGTTSPPTGMVAVTPEGKLYHRPDCGYIHGPVHMEPGAQAVADGYAPCTRCMKEARRNASEYLGASR
jgi:hypothetical protein